MVLFYEVSPVITANRMSHSFCPLDLSPQDSPVSISAKLSGIMTRERQAARGGKSRHSLRSVLWALPFRVTFLAKSEKFYLILAQ